MTDAIARDGASVGPLEPDVRFDATSTPSWRVPAVWFALFGLQTLMSLVLAPYGADENGDFRDLLMLFSFGAFIGQPLLIAIAAGLWSGRWLLAAPVGLALTVLLAHFANFANVAYPQRATYGDIELLVIWGEAYVCLLAPLSIARWLGGWRILVPHSATSQRDSNQFHLRGLMGMVAAVAVVLAIVRITAVPMQWSERVKPLATVMADTLVTGGVIAICLCGAMPLIGAVLATSNRRQHVIASLLGLTASASFLWWVLAPGNLEEVLAWAMVCGGAVTSLLFNLGVLRRCGLRLMRVVQTALPHGIG